LLIRNLIDSRTIVNLKLVRYSYLFMYPMNLTETLSICDECVNYCV
jgi:hypothetical protein